MTEFKIDKNEFEYLSKMIYDNFGIQLNESKKTLLEGRLQKILRKNNLAGFKDYIAFLKSSSDIFANLGELADNISTNHTFFWREPKHFEIFRDQVLPELKRTQIAKKKIRVWCAASSTGEEPYQLAILLKNHFKHEYQNWDAGVLATDISDRALNVAEKGIYSNERVSKLPKEILNAGFDKIQDHWQVKHDVRNDVTYRRFNLMNPLPFKSMFDVVFCRNVMIYFDEETRKALVKRIYDKMNPGGLLFISLSESLNRETCPFKYISPGLYKKI